MVRRTLTFISGASRLERRLRLGEAIGHAAARDETEGLAAAPAARQTGAGRPMPAYPAIAA